MLPASQVQDRQVQDRQGQTALIYSQQHTVPKRLLVASLSSFPFLRAFSLHSHLGIRPLQSGAV